MPTTDSLDPSTTESPERQTVLVVEDEAPNRALVIAIFRRATDTRVAAVQLLEASSLRRARELLAQRRVDLVLLDVRLPDGNGLDLAAELADVEPRPRILVMSASVLPVERDAASRAGADAFLAKPYRPTELLDVVARLLDSSQPHV